MTEKEKDALKDDQVVDQSVEETTPVSEAKEEKTPPKKEAATIK